MHPDIKPNLHRLGFFVSPSALALQSYYKLGAIKGLGVVNTKSFIVIKLDPLQFYHPHPELRIRLHQGE